MVHLLVKILAGFFLILVILVAWVFMRSWQVAHDKRDNLFIRGTLPDPLPDGFYKGSIGSPVSWEGKQFNSQAGTGTNIFSGGVERYKFITYSGKSVTNPATNVLKIDYDITGNPWWLRYILDEIVQTSPNHYLGKMMIQIIPKLPLQVTYFTLER